MAIAKLPRRRWHEMTTNDVAAAPGAGWIAVLPISAIEQHGPHLPLSTDAAIAEGLVEAAISRMPEDLPVTVLPLFAIGKSNEHIASPGTLTLGATTLIAAATEIGESVHRAGVDKLVIINSHGGNVAVLDIVARDLRVRLGMLVVATAWSRFGNPPGVFPDSEAAYGIHGGDFETSVMLHLRPDLVRMEHAADFCSLQQDMARDFTHLRAHGTHPFAWTAQDLNPAGVVGNAAAATAEKGRATVEHQADGFVALCRDVATFDMARLDRRPH